MYNNIYLFLVGGVLTTMIIIFIQYYQLGEVKKYLIKMKNFLSLIPAEKISDKIIISLLK